MTSLTCFTWIILFQTVCALRAMDSCNSTTDLTECRPFNNETDVPIGEAVNIFNSYGFLSSSFKVVSNFQRNNDEDPLFKVDTHSVLDRQKFRTNVKIISR